MTDGDAGKEKEEDHSELRGFQVLPSVLGLDTWVSEASRGSRGALGQKMDEEVRATESLV